jgi:spore maturation protein CgeB
VVEMRQPSQLVTFWDVDAPATLERLDENPGDPFAKLISQFDLILTYGGGKPVVEGYKSYGAHACHPIYNGFDPDTHYPVSPQQTYAAELSLLANRLPDRETRVDEFFFSPAHCLPNRRFLLAGNGWADKSMPKNVRYLGHLYTSDHNAFNSSSCAVLNINRASMARNGYSPATRVFEAAGAAACMVTDFWEGIEEFFEPGREILVAQTGAGVVDLLGSLTTVQAHSIGQAAYRRATAQHTYSHRAETLGTLIEATVKK